MNGATELDRQEEDVPGFEISDDALECAAGSETAVYYTLGYCTSVQFCPAW
jgi:hypothetical protein